MLKRSELLNNSLVIPSLAQHRQLRSSHLKNCVFCSPAPTLVLKQTANFQLMIEPFPIVSGHVLLSSRDHFGCAGELDAAQCLELEALKHHVKSSLTLKYGSVV